MSLAIVMQVMPVRDMKAARIISILALLATMLLITILTPASSFAREKNLTWTTQQTSCNNERETGRQEIATDSDVPLIGRGSVEFRIGDNPDTFVAIRNAGYHNVKLSDLTEFSYSTYIERSKIAQAPYAILNVDVNSDGKLDDLLFFRPLYQDGSYNTSLPQQPKIALKTWQQWDALSGGWWSLEGYVDATPAAGVKPLSTYIEKYPDARIVNAEDGEGGVRIAVGCRTSSDNFVGYVDNITIGVGGEGITYNFEPTGRPATPAPTKQPEVKAEGEKPKQSLAQKATSFLGKLFLR